MSEEDHSVVSEGYSHYTMSEDDDSIMSEDDSSIVSEDSREDSNSFAVNPDGDYTVDEMLERIAAEQAREDREDPKDFLCEGCFGTEIFEALCQLFAHYASRQVHWQRLVMASESDYDEHYEPTLLHDVLRIANEASLFADIYLILDDMFYDIIHPGRLPSMERNARLPSLEKNYRLKYLFLLLDMELSMSGIESLIKTLQTTKSLSELSMSVPSIARPPIVEALASNSSLSKVTLTVRYEQAALDIARALNGHGHSQLKCLILHIETDDAESALRDEAVRILLTSNTCQLEELRIGFPFLRNGPNPLLTTDVLVRALADNRCLQSYSTNGWWLSGAYPFSKLLGAVRSHSKLELLLLNQPFTIQDIQQATRLEQFPRRLEIYNHRFEWPPNGGRYETAVRAFLDKHWEVSMTSEAHRETYWPQCVEYASHLNQSGRCLMRNKSMPPGLWALVLENIGKSRKYKEGVYQASIVYELLHGPALAGSGA